MKAPGIPAGAGQETSGHASHTAAAAAAAALRGAGGSFPRCRVSRWAEGLLLNGCRAGQPVIPAAALCASPNLCHRRFKSPFKCRHLLEAPGPSAHFSGSSSTSNSFPWSCTYLEFPSPKGCFSAVLWLSARPAPGRCTRASLTPPWPGTGWARPSSHGTSRQSYSWSNPTNVQNTVTESLQNQTLQRALLPASSSFCASLGPDELNPPCF